MDILTTSAIYVIPFVLVLSIVVFIHEYGHFIVGRWCGIKVDAFSIGFGPSYGRVLTVMARAGA